MLATSTYGGIAWPRACGWWWRGALLAGLLRHIALMCVGPAPQELKLDAGLSSGEVCRLEKIWRELGFHAWAGVFRRSSFFLAISTPTRATKRLVILDIQLPLSCFSSNLLVYEHSRSATSMVPQHRCWTGEVIS